MSLYFQLEFSFLSIFCCFRVVKTVVPDYCLEPLNRSDCGGRPTDVVMYWKPGSRCEVATWRGCPTLNKFKNEYECSDLCIFRLDNNDEVIDECELTLNEYRCSDVEETVYTYVEGDCVRKTWRGCATSNKFDTQTDCEKACIDNWEEHIENESLERLEDVDEEIKEVLKEVSTTGVPMTTEEATAGEEEVTAPDEEEPTTEGPQQSESEEEVIITK
ncbi:uncharacterized protein LOC142972193 [Anticarsia gemmatalis]|uniref:uncharacterized protein LOC142972193 n=1 Tax=Anticarsia gemmatalis TaxID=129554 RepID=UPI003F75F435